MNVLIVDDDKDMCLLIGAILHEEGFGVSVAHDAESAFRKLRTQLYDAMVLDYKLGAMSGLAVLEKAQEGAFSVPTVMISAFGNEFIRTRARELGACAFLDKPFDIEDLARHVKKAVRSKKKIVDSENKGKKAVSDTE